MGRCARGAVWLGLLLGALALAGFPGAAWANPAPQVEITPLPDGGYQVVTPIYKAHINLDGNLHSLQVNGSEFLDDRVTGSAGASFFVDRPITLPTMALKDRELTATDGTYTVQYQFDEGFFRLTLRHGNPHGAAYIAVCAPRIDYVENVTQSGMAAAPVDCDWPDVVMTVPSGEYVEFRGGTRIWGRGHGREVWELSNIAPNKDYTVMCVPGQKAPRTPDLSQLTELSATLNDSDARLLPVGNIAELQLRFENNSHYPINTEATIQVESSHGKALLENRKPLSCPSHQAVTLTWSFAPKEADFYTAHCAVNLGGAPKKLALTFGYDVASIAPAAQRPADFTDYWNRLQAEARTAEVTLTRLEDPTRSTSTVTVYRVGLTADHFTCFGWLASPKFPGRYPGLLLLPGDRVRYISPNASLADCGFVVMTIEPTGQPVDGTLKPLITQASMNLANPAAFGLREIMIRDLRAVTALASVPDVDPDRLAVTGVGLGGGMALMIAALDDRIQAVAPDVPFYCGIEQGKYLPDWPYWEVASYLRKHPGEQEPVLRTLRYYDVENFADKIDCPVLISAGVEDMYSRPGNIYAVFNQLPGPRAIKLYNAGHDGGGVKHWEEKMRWLGQVLGAPSPLPAAALTAPATDGADGAKP